MVRHAQRVASREALPDYPEGCQRRIRLDGSVEWVGLNTPAWSTASFTQMPYPVPSGQNVTQLHQYQSRVIRLDGSVSTLPPRPASAQPLTQPPWSAAPYGPQSPHQPGDHRRPLHPTYAT